MAPIASFGLVPIEDGGEEGGEARSGRDRLLHLLQIRVDSHRPGFGFDQILCRGCYVPLLVEEIAIAIAGADRSRAVGGGEDGGVGVGEDGVVAAWAAAE